MRYRSRNGFIFLAGVRTLYRDDGTRQQGICPRCGRSVELLGKRGRSWLTLFMVPLIPVGGAKQITECPNCQARFALTPEELARRSEQHVAGNANQRGIQLYNSLRASPANSVTLNELMHLYGGVGEFHEAIRSAGQFPKALEASEQCMVTLARAYIEVGLLDEAQTWLRTALERNPQMAEARYHLAVVLMRRPPPDLSGAIAAARAARNGGFAEAEDLLRELQEMTQVKPE